MASADLDKIVRAHNAIKDARTVKRRAWESEDLELETAQNKLKVFMLELLNRSNAKSIATEAGTVYRRTTLKPSAADWGAIWEWAKANDGMDIFERRLKKAFLEQYMEEHDGELPPGVNAHREFEVAVRRSDTASKQEDE